MDQIDMQSNEELKTSVRRLMERLAAGKRFVHPVRWLATHGHPCSHICDRVRAEIAAMPIEQRGEFVVDGDEAPDVDQEWASYVIGDRLRLSSGPKQDQSRTIRFSQAKRNLLALNSTSTRNSYS